LFEQLIGSTRSDAQKRSDISIRTAPGSDTARMLTPASGLGEALLDRLVATGCAFRVVWEEVGQAGR